MTQWPIFWTIRQTYQGRGLWVTMQRLIITALGPLCPTCKQPWAGGLVEERPPCLTWHMDTHVSLRTIHFSSATQQDHNLLRTGAEHAASLSLQTSSICSKEYLVPWRVMSVSRTLKLQNEDDEDMQGSLRLPLLHFLTDLTHCGPWSVVLANNTSVASVAEKKINHYQILPLSIFRWCLKSSKFPRCLETYQAHPSRSRSLSERWTLQSRARRTCLWRFASADYGHQLDLCNHQGPCLWQLNDIKRHSTTFNDFGQNMISSLEWSKPAKSAWSVPKSIQCFLSSGPMDDSIVANMAADELMVAQVKSKQPVKTWVPWLQAHDPDRAQQFQLHLDHMSAFYIWTLRKNNFLTVAGSMCKDLHIRTFQSLSINTCKKRIIMSTIVHLIWGCKIMPT